MRGHGRFKRFMVWKPIREGRGPELEEAPFDGKLSIKETSLKPKEN